MNYCNTLIQNELIIPATTLNVAITKCKVPRRFPCLTLPVVMQRRIVAENDVYSTSVEWTLKPGNKFAYSCSGARTLASRIARLAKTTIPATIQKA